MDHVALGRGRPQEGWLASTDDSLFRDFIDSLFQDSRDTNSIVFRGEYPTEALMDDIAVYQPLEFIHECVKMRHLLLSTVARVETEETRSATSMSRRIASMGRVRRHILGTRHGIGG